MNDPLYNHTVFGPEKGKGGNIGKSDEKLIADLISIHNAENWLGMDGDSELSMFNKGEDGETIEDIAVKLLDNKKDGECLKIYCITARHWIKERRPMPSSYSQQSQGPIQSKFKRYCKFYCLISSF